PPPRRPPADPRPRTDLTPRTSSAVKPPASCLRIGMILIKIRFTNGSLRVKRNAVAGSVVRRGAVRVLVPRRGLRGRRSGWRWRPAATGPPPRRGTRRRGLVPCRPAPGFGTPILRPLPRAGASLHRRPGHRPRPAGAARRTRHGPAGLSQRALAGLRSPDARLLH